MNNIKKIQEDTEKLSNLLVKYANNLYIDMMMTRVPISELRLLEKPGVDEIYRGQGVLLGYLEGINGLSERNLLARDEDGNYKYLLSPSILKFSDGSLLHTFIRERFPDDTPLKAEVLAYLNTIELDAPIEEEIEGVEEEHINLLGPDLPEYVSQFSKLVINLYNKMEQMSRLYGLGFKYVSLSESFYREIRNKIKLNLSTNEKRKNNETLVYSKLSLINFIVENVKKMGIIISKNATIYNDLFNFLSSQQNKVIKEDNIVHLLLSTSDLFDDSLSLMMRLLESIRILGNGIDEVSKIGRNMTGNIKRIQEVLNQQKVRERFSSKLNGQIKPQYKHVKNQMDYYDTYEVSSNNWQNNQVKRGRLGQTPSELDIEVRKAENNTGENLNKLSKNLNFLRQQLSARKMITRSGLTNINTRPVQGLPNIL